MKHYPEIAGSAKAPLGSPCLAFEKYDGSNLRWEWSPKRGWYKFGTRTQLFDHTDSLFGQAIPIFLNTMGGEISRRCLEVERGVREIIVFTEFFGPKTFAGKHVLEDPKELRLFDVNPYKRGIMHPRRFWQTFQDLSYCARLIYQGNLNQPFIDGVRAGLYPVWEGVVAKLTDTHINNMFKIKTAAYLKRLQEVFGNDYANYKRYWE